MTAVSVAERPDAHTTGATLRVVVVNGSPSRQSKTLGLVAVVLDTLKGMLPVAASQVDVYRLGPAFTGALERDDVTPDVEAALRLVEESDFLVAATPVYRGSYPGMFKHFFDLVDQYALANKPVLLAATGGGDHHALVLEHALRPLFAFFQALTVPVAIFGIRRGLRRRHAARPPRLRTHRDSPHRRGGPAQSSRNGWNNPERRPATRVSPTPPSSRLLVGGVGIGLAAPNLNLRVAEPVPPEHRGGRVPRRALRVR